MSAFDKTYQQLCRFAAETALLSSTESILGWDERTMMPPAAAAYRAEQMTLLSGLIHTRRTDPRLGQWLGELAASPLAADPHSDSGTVIRQLKREYDKRVKLPQSLVEELTRTASLAQHAWQQAGQKTISPRSARAGKDLRAQTGPGRSAGLYRFALRSLARRFRAGRVDRQRQARAGRAARGARAAGGRDRRQQPPARRGDPGPALPAGRTGPLRPRGGGAPGLQFRAAGGWT